MSVNILGISAFYHDSAACLVRNGEIVAAAQEERFTRKKHDFSFPENAIRYCLQEGGISSRELDYVAFYDKPLLKLERILETYLAVAPKGLRTFLKAIPLWMKQKIWIRNLIQEELGYSGPIFFPEHHESHAASAFFPSPFSRAAILTVDGVGEWATSSWGVGQDNHFRLVREMHFPHSLGLLYSAFTYYCGFRVNSGEYKLMGLAPYGEPRFVSLILRELMDLKGDGSFRLNLSYFNFLSGETMTHTRFHRLFDAPPRKPGEPLKQLYMDVAASIQQVTEMVLMRMVNHIHRETGEKHLVLAGGVALNSVANGRILREGPFERIWIQPAAGDAGGALGAALFVWFQLLNQPRRTDEIHDFQKGSLLGPSFSDREIESVLKRHPVHYRKLSHQELLNTTVRHLSEGKVIGWFQGRMEFGPRALGNRSILADARNPEMQQKLNLKIKFRESFRPFAPAVLRENVNQYFTDDWDSPYMLLVTFVHPRQRLKGDSESPENWRERLRHQRSRIPAVTHVDNSARIQTVDPEHHPLFYQLLKRFAEHTGTPVLVNTSFNVRGEPIVCTPQDALTCFLNTHMDFLAIGPFWVEKARQTDERNMQKFRQQFAPD